MASIIKWRVARFTIDNVTWTDIVIPAGVGLVTSLQLFNSDANDMKLRSDKNDATTEKTLFSGVQEIFPSGAIPLDGVARAGRWFAGDVVCSVQSAAGVGPAILTMNG